MTEQVTDEPSNIGNSKEEPAKISKSQLKKQLKLQRWLEKRPQRRLQEREKKKERRRKEAELRAEEKVSDDTTGEGKISKKQHKFKLMSESDNPFRVVVDLDFEDLMTDSELSKCCQQVGRIYAANRHSTRPCQLHICSVRGQVKDKFDKINAGNRNWDINMSEKNYGDVFAADRSKIVYLSGDSENILDDTEVLLKDKAKIFVIGGLVDHNRHKNLCQKRAEERSIQTARLPIKESNVKLSQRHILSTVTVFEILMRVLGERQSWSDALLNSIPKRKLNIEKEKEEKRNKQEAD